MASRISQSLLTLASSLIVLSVLHPHAAVSAVNTKRIGNTEVCDFRCWIENMVIHIPVIEISKYDIVLHNGTCDHITFDKLNSDRNDKDITFDLTIQQLSFNCSIPYTLTLGKNKHKGYFSAKLLPTTAFGMSLQIIRGNNGLAVSSKTAVNSDLHLSKFEIHGDKGIVKVAEEILQFAVNLLDNQVNSLLNSEANEQIPPLIDNNLGKLLDEIDPIILDLINTPTTYPTPPAPPGSINWNTSPTVGLLDFILNKMIGTTGNLSLNRLLDLFVANGTFSLDLKDKFAFDIPNFGTVEAGVTSIGLAGLDSWNQFDILTPVGNHSLKIQTGMARLDFIVNFFVKVDVTGIVSSGSLYEEGSLRLNLTGNNLDMEAMFAFSEEYADNLNITVLNAGCLESATKAFNITKMALDVSVAEFALLPLSGDLEKDIDLFVTNIIMLLVTAFDPVIPQIISGFLAGPLRTAVNTGATSLIGDNSKCTQSPSPFQSFEDQFLVTWIVYGLFTVIAVLIIFYMLARRRRQDKKGHYDSESSINDSSPLVMKDSMADGGVLDNSLATHPRVPFWAKVFMPISIIFGVASFISANTANGAVVTAMYATGNETVVLAEVFKFTLANSVREMYESGVYPLAFVIAIASGMWPYLKLLLTWMCWFVSPRTKLCGMTVLPKARRERILRALDMLGKWSLIDAFVLTLMVTAFRIHVQKNDSAAIDLYVFPEWGIFGFVMATILSLIISHVMLHYHRSVERRDAVYAAITDRIPLRSRPFTAYGRKFQFPVFGQVFIVLLLILSIVLIGLGSAVESFRFIFTGVADVLFDAFDIATVESYSLVSLVMDLPSSALNPNDAGIRIIQLIVLILALCVPILVNVLLIALWVLPMVPLAQRRLLTAVEIVNAWAMLEVFILAIIVALTEIKQFAAFIVGSKCDDLQPFLNHLAPLDGGDSVCFSVSAKLDSGCWYLNSACLLYIIVGLVVIEACTVVLHDIVARHEEQQGGNSSSMNAINEGRDAEKKQRSCGIISAITEKFFLLLPYLGLLEEVQQV